jgi:hypothetical protein
MPKFVDEPSLRRTISREAKAENLDKFGFLRPKCIH